MIPESLLSDRARKMWCPSLDSLHRASPRFVCRVESLNCSAFSLYSVSNGVRSTDHWPETLGTSLKS